LVNYYVNTNQDHLLHFAEDNNANLYNYPQEDPPYKEFIDVGCQEKFGLQTTVFPQFNFTTWGMRMTVRPTPEAKIDKNDP
jgi:hypothetical protein